MHVLNDAMVCEHMWSPHRVVDLVLLVPYAKTRQCGSLLAWFPLQWRHYFVVSVPKHCFAVAVPLQWRHCSAATSLLYWRCRFGSAPPLHCFVAAILCPQRYYPHRWLRGEGYKNLHRKIMHASGCLNWFIARTFSCGVFVHAACDHANDEGENYRSASSSCKTNSGAFCQCRTSCCNCNNYTDNSYSKLDPHLACYFVLQRDCC